MHRVAVAVVLLLLISFQQIDSESNYTLYQQIRKVQGLPVKQCICPLSHRPVCGSNDQTYSNICIAKCKSIVSFENKIKIKE